ncbi:G2 mitotic-specific cyclin C13-like [Raphidocelis subcapitata]|uniref:G2 mitotic-specific cyclin C13-like n=1 Tax=Raphidocelis subcapitata TaxID=307507 RepID=A0A2V0PQB5_9CHLO|nr:G2 mitotic-specific cyclin C13-like [Raphidocelis subcapitata]|eukprot:GBF99395.1 G2 mitotic-specific cyclin C13-like [Raphidocelis subcapitata]
MEARFAACPAVGPAAALKAAAIEAHRLQISSASDVSCSTQACCDVTGARDQQGASRQDGARHASMCMDSTHNSPLLCIEPDGVGGGCSLPVAAPAGPAQQPYPPKQQHPQQQHQQQQQQPAPCSALGPPSLDLDAMIRSQRAREAALRPDPRYLEAQAAAAAAAGAPPSALDALTPQMRMIVASWMVEVADEFSLQPETLHLAVALLDRFLSATVPQGVPRGVLQMVAVACIMVAGKHLEVSHPSVEQLVAIAANCFTAQDLLRMERVLLDALDFGVAAPTGFTFLHLYAQGLRGLAPPVAALAVYLLDVALLDYSLLEFPPSLLAAAALALSMRTHGDGAGAARALAIAGYAPRDAARATGCLLSLHQNAAWPASEAVRDLLAPLAAKYSQAAWCCAALCQPLPGLDAGWFA